MPVLTLEATERDVVRLEVKPSASVQGFNVGATEVPSAPLYALPSTSRDSGAAREHGVAERRRQASSLS